MSFNPITLFLCGDVMTGRGIDQALPHPGRPHLHEPSMTSALGYVELAEAANGPIPRPVDFSYIWGDALTELQRAAPDARIINLETSVTRSERAWPGKSIHYRMHPGNVPCLAAAKIDGCALANNHVLDWGEEGLLETLRTLERAGMKTAGAGRTQAEAETPAVIDLGGKGRVLLFSFGSQTAGVPPEWAASGNRPGVNFLADLSERTGRRIAAAARAVKRPGDIVVASVHWGGNWGYGVPREQVRFTHQLIEEAGVDLVHGHSSHHPKAIEVYQGRLILYGCGDFFDDYEGIPGYEEFRDDLTLMYVARVDPSSGRLLGLQMTPLQIRRFRLRRASAADAQWLRDVLTREGRPFGTRVELDAERTLVLRWS
ncbi:MAG: CapA family protein [Nitrospirota bacterium]